MKQNNESLEETKISEKNENVEEISDEALDDVSGGVMTATRCIICGSRKGPFHGTLCDECYKKRKGSKRLI